jgi:hypothetical protein
VEISHDDEVCAVLADPAFIVPPVLAVESPVGLAWLRSHMGRFSSGSRVCCGCFGCCDSRRSAPLRRVLSERNPRIRTVDSGGHRPA